MLAAISPAAAACTSDISQAVSELTLIIGAFRYSRKTDMGRETWYCRVPAIVEKWPPLSEDFARRRSDAEGGDAYGHSPFRTVPLCLDAPHSTTLRNTRERPMLKISLPSGFHDLTGRSTLTAAALAAFVLLGA